MRFSLMLGAMLTISSTSLASTEVVGNLTTDTHWTQANGPYLLSGDVTVAAGATLTIDPGVLVTVSATDKLGAGVNHQTVELIINGALRANGTASNPITFQGVVSGDSSWWGIRFEVGASASSLTFATITDANNAVDVKSSIAPTLTDLSISNVSFGINWNSAASADLERINVERYSVRGLMLQDDTFDSSPAGAAIIVNECTVQGGQLNAIAVDVNARVTATVTASLLALNYYCVFTRPGSALTLENSVLAGNTGDAVYIQQTGSNVFNIVNNTIDANFTQTEGGNVVVASADTPTQIHIRSNIITNAAYGILVESQTNPTDVDWNDVWGNAHGYDGAHSTLNPGPHDLQTNPLFTRAVGDLPSSPGWVTVPIGGTCSGSGATLKCPAVYEFDAGWVRLNVGTLTNASLLVQDRSQTGGQTLTAAGTTAPILGNSLVISLIPGPSGTGTATLTSVDYLPIAYNYRLPQNSPCVGAGTNTGAPGVDADGAPRPSNSTLSGALVTDIGAYQFHSHVPPVAIAGIPQTVLSNSIVSFDGSASYDPDGTIVSYSWDFGDGTPAGTHVAPTHSYARAGTFTVTLTVTDDSAATGTGSVMIIVTDDLTPIAIPGPNQVVPLGTTVMFDGSSSYDPDGAIVSWQWDFGDGAPAVSGATAAHQYATSGVRAATLTVTDNQGISASGITYVTTVAPAGPVAVAGASKTVTLGESVTLDGSASHAASGQITSYSWDFGDGQMGAGSSVMHSYETPGAFIVTLTVTDNLGVTGSGLTSVIVVPPEAPVAVAGAQQTVTLGQAVTLDGTQSHAASQISGYQWDLGDGDMASGATVMHTYETAGAFIVTLTVTDGRGVTASSVTSVIVVAPGAPVAVAGAQQTVALGQSVTLDGSGSHASSGQLSDFSWDLGDGHTAASSMVTHTYATAGAFIVRLTVTDDRGVTGSDVTSVIVVAPGAPVALASAPQTVTLGQSVTLDGSGSHAPSGDITSYAWDFGDGAMGSGSMVMHTYASAGVFIVTLTVTDSAGGVATAMTGVTVATPAPTAPTAVAGADVMGSAGTKVSFDGSGSTGQIIAYEWDFGDGGSAAGVAADHVYGAAGTFTVTLTVVSMDGLKGTSKLTARITGAQLAKTGGCSSSGGVSILAFCVALSMLVRRVPRQRRDARATQ